MSTGRTTHVAVALAIPGVVVDANPVDVRASDLIGLVRTQFDEQGEIAPPEDHLFALARVAAGFLRTSPLRGNDTAEGQRQVVGSLVTVAFGWWTRDAGEYVHTAALLDDVFRQRETAVPDGAAMEMLLAVAVGLLRQRGIPPAAKRPQLAIADWIASLYLAGLDDW